MSVSVEPIVPISDLEAPVVAPPKHFGDAGCNGNSVRWVHRRLPAFLVSLIVNTMLLLVLALWSLAPSAGPGTDFQLDVSLSRDSRDELLPVEMALAPGESSPAPPSAPSSSEHPQSKSSELSRMPALSTLLANASVAQETTTSESDLKRLLRATSEGTSISFAVSGIDGRKPAARRELALARGGSAESERAVERALEWLAAHQLPNGSWSLVHNTGTCNGQCAHIGSRERFEPAATGLSLLAFLGAGYTHKDGKYQNQVKAAIYYLVQIQQDTPQGGSFLHGCDRGMYNHGIAAFALCEAFQMTGDDDLHKPAQDAINFIASAQNLAGGWGYLPKQPGDLTLSGWQVMALKSAAAAGLYVRPDVILRIDKFLDSQTNQEAVYYGYSKPGKSPTCTAIGLLLRLFRNWPNSDPRVLQGIAYLRKIGVTNNDAYYNYYTTLLLFHTGGTNWIEWNARMRDYLVSTQRTSGHESGSWYFENAFGKEGGRLYTTAMCAMTLEVYYRFAPLYLQADQDFRL